MLSQRDPTGASGFDSSHPHRSGSTSTLRGRGGLGCPHERAVHHLPGQLSAFECGARVEREFQLDRGGQWDKGKSCETFNPLGPWLVTADEVPDPQALSLRLWVNDEIRQDGTTANMEFGVHHLVWYISQFLVLRPGDVVNTGTPAGVALGRSPGAYLRAGDAVRLEIRGLGHQRQTGGQA